MLLKAGRVRERASHPLAARGQTEVFTIMIVFMIIAVDASAEGELVHSRVAFDTCTRSQNVPGVHAGGYPRFLVKLALYILLVGLSVSLLFRQVEWPWIAFRQGETAFDRGHYLDAAAFYERAAQKLNDPRILERLAKCWLAADRSDKAETVLSHLLQQHPELVSTKGHNKQVKRFHSLPSTSRWEGN